jgi:hypothetical protein
MLLRNKICKPQSTKSGSGSNYRLIPSPFQYLACIVQAKYGLVHHREYNDVSCVDIKRLENLKAQCYCTMLIFTCIADINCLVSCGGLDNENPEVRKARYHIFHFLLISSII